MRPEIERPDRTPSLPDWIRKPPCPTPGYTNIYDICPEETRLYGTESLFGNWNSRVLLLAQDFAPVEVVKEWRNDGHKRPFSHDESCDTNHRLCQFWSEYGLCEEPLYGSAFAGLLRDGWKWRGPLRNIPYKHLRKVLTQCVVPRMPNLRVIVCLGGVAWNIARVGLGMGSRTFKQQRESCLPAQSRIQAELAGFALYHPAWEASDEKDGWKGLGDYLRGIK